MTVRNFLGTIKSIISAAGILGLACAPVLAKDRPRGIYNQRDDIANARADVRAAARGQDEGAATTTAAGANVGWSFSILFMRHSFDTGYSHVHPTRYGMYASQAECEQARAERINILESDASNPTAPIMQPMREWVRESADLRMATGTQTAETPSAKGNEKDDRVHGRREQQRQGGTAHSFNPEGCVAHVFEELPRTRRAGNP